MSGLLPGGTPSGATGAGRAQNGASRPTQGAGGYSAGQTRILTPTQVMAQRTAREARRREEAARQGMQDEQSRRQPTDDVVGVGDNRQQASGRPPLTEITPNNPTSTRASGRTRNDNVPTTNGSTTRTRTATIANPAQPRPTSSQPDSGQINKNRTEALEKLSMPAIADPKPAQTQNINYQQPPASEQPSARQGFPHAFERWEQLSSQWEGLTSYWIRRLETNTEELAGKPIDQQIARQVTDLSAAGANLFHAVVELQKLRASSERKFQRWYFETRHEQEQARERVAELEQRLRHARETDNTSSASVEAVRAEKTKAEELVREMRRELQISKEEARRAWEELGRREQEERERTFALRNGEPTLIGGVQVVPMAGMVSRHMGSSSRPQTRGGPIPGGPGPSQMSGQERQQERGDTFSRSQTTLESPDQEQAQFSYQPGATSPTETDPFTERSQPLRHEPDTQFYSSTPQSQPPSNPVPASARSAISPTRGQTQSNSPSRFYQQTATSTSVYQPITTTAPSYRPVTSATDRSDGRSYIPSSTSGHGSEEEYHVNPDGSYTRDAQGRRIPSNQPISGPGIDEPGDEEEEEDDDEDYTAEVERERMYAQQYSQRQAAIAQAQATPQMMSGESPVSPPSATSMMHRSTTLPSPPAQAQASPASRSYSSTISAPSQPTTMPSNQPTHARTQSASSTGSSIPAYDGSGYTTSATIRNIAEDDDIPSNIVTGWESIGVTPRHHHPSRLSAILEERSGRTSPSRGSYVSESNPASQRGGGYGNTTGTSAAAAARRPFSP